MANNFINFIYEIKLSYKEGISNDFFENLLFESKTNFNFIKSIVFKFEAISKDKMFFPYQGSTNCLDSDIVPSPSTLGKKRLVPMSSKVDVIGSLNLLGESSQGSLNVSGQSILVKKGVAPKIPIFSKVNFFGPTNILGKRRIGQSNSETNVSGPILIKKGMVPNISISTGPLSPCHNTTTGLVSSPVPSDLVGNTTINTSPNNKNGIRVFTVNELDLKKNLNFVANKYKLDYLFVANLLIDCNLPYVEHNNITTSNCYFKLNDFQKSNIKIPCEWKIFRGSYKSYLINFENNNGQLKAVLHNNCSQDSNLEVFKLTVKQLRTKCSSNFINFRYNLTSLTNLTFSENLYLLIGKPGTDCKCLLKSKQLEILKNNIHLKTPHLYNKFHNYFSSTRNIYNVKRNLNKDNKCSVSSKNPVDNIQDLKKLVNSGDKFVRAYSNLAGDLPGFVLYYEEQIADIFSHANSGKIILHVDKTYDLGIYHVTCLSYKNVKLLTKEFPKGNPLFLGPIFVHKKSKNINFDYFFEHLKKKFDELSLKLNCNTNYQHKMVFCSDQERAIINGIRKSFPFSRIIFCYTHLQGNVLRNVDSTELSKKINKLVFCKSLNEFNDAVINIYENNNFKSIKNIYKRNYIHQELTTIYLNILLPKWQLNLSKPLTNNLAESCNNKVKELVGRVYVSPDKLVKDLKVLVQNQFINVGKAFEGEGDFQFPHYQAPQIELSEDQKNRLVNHFLNNCIDIAVPEVPAKKTKRATFSKFLINKDGRPYIESSDKMESYPAWLMSQVYKPNHSGRRKTNSRPKF